MSDKPTAHHAWLAGHTARQIQRLAIAIRHLSCRKPEEYYDVHWQYAEDLRILLDTLIPRLAKYEGIENSRFESDRDEGIQAILCDEDDIDENITPEDGGPDRE